MIRFFKSTIFFIVFIIVFLELMLRATGLASDVMERELNEEGVIVYKPGTEGYRTRGMRAEVDAFYHINTQGWNSIKNYDSIPENSIAILGDSYVANFWNPVDKSIGSLLKEIFDQNGYRVTVHDYGHSGANFEDYRNFIPQLKKKGYNVIFVFVGPKDFVFSQPTFTGKSKFIQRDGVISLYKYSHLLRYLNINLGVSHLMRGLLKTKSVESREVSSEMIAKAVQTIKEKNIYFFYESPQFNQFDSVGWIRVIHQRRPYDHGFNGHWNINGNTNAACSIYNYLLKNKLLASFK